MFVLLIFEICTFLCLLFFEKLHDLYLTCFGFVFFPLGLCKTLKSISVFLSEAISVWAQTDLSNAVISNRLSYHLFSALQYLAGRNGSVSI